MEWEETGQVIRVCRTYLMIYAEFRTLSVKQWEVTEIYYRGK